MIGKENYFVGLVVNCKADPCLKVKNDIVYVPELEREDPEFMGESVSVTGTLPEKKIIPDPKVDESGAISTGAYGNQLVLENISEIRTV